MNMSTTQTPYELLGGSVAISRIVERFYDLMDSEAEFAALQHMHADNLGPMRQSLAGFLAGWSGGPRHWFDQNPGKCMMSAHAGLGVNQETARQWMDCMTRAVADCGLADHAVAKLMLERFTMMSRGMAGRS